MMKSKALIISALIICTFMAWSLPIYAANEDIVDPVPAFTPNKEIDTSPVKLPKITRKQYKNGLTIYYVPQDELPVVSVRLLILSGGLYNPLEKPGLTGFMSDLLTKGTKNRTASQIAEEIDFVGGNLNSGAGWNGSYIQVNVLERDLEMALELMSDVALNPSFPEEEIERLRQQVVSSIMMNKDDPSTIADEQYSHFVYGEHPYGYPAVGTAESVMGFTRDDLVDQYKRLFVPGNAVLALAGDINVKKANKLVSKYFGDWKKGSIPKPELSDPSRTQGREILFVDKPDAVQSEIRMGYVLAPYNLGDDLYAFRLMNYMFGGGGFSSRLMLKIRNELGLTYGISSNLSARQQNGAFNISSFTKSASTGELIEESIKVMDRILEEGFTEEELHDAKSFLLGQYPNNFETPSSIATQFQSALLFNFGDPADYIKDYRAKLNDVSLEAVNQAARKYLNPQWLRITIVGKADESLGLVEKFGEVKKVSIDDI